MSRPQGSPVHIMARSIGQHIDSFLMKTTPMISYVTHLMLRVPLVFAIHYWLLLGPQADNIIFNLLTIAGRIVVAYSMARSWHFITETLLLYYTAIFYELCISMLQESLYWMFKDVCLASRNVTPWDIFYFWCMPALIAVLVECFYFGFSLYTYYKFQGSFERDKCCLAFVAYLTPLICSFGILPNSMATVWFYARKIGMGFILMSKMFNLENAETTAVKKHLDKEVETSINRRDKHISLMNNLTDNRAIFLCFGTLYFGLNLIFEIIWYKNDMAYLASMFVIIKFVYGWSTTYVIVLTFASLSGFLATFITGIGFWFTTWEINITDAMKINTGETAQICFVTLLVEAGIPTRNINLDLESLTLVAVFTTYLILQQTFDHVLPKILEISSRGSKLSIWFGFRVSIVFVLSYTCISPVMTLGRWVMFVSSGGLAFTSTFLSFLIEWLLVSLMWYTDRYLVILQNFLYYLQILKQITYVLLLSFQFYSRYYIRSFTACWMLRAGILSYFYICFVLPLLNQWKEMYNKRKKKLRILNSLSDVSYNNEHTDCKCSICFATIFDGKELPCLHTFHTECLQLWFQERTVCPTCNSDVK